MDYCNIAFSHLHVRTTFCASFAGSWNLYFSRNCSGSSRKAAGILCNGILTLPGIFPGLTSSVVFLTSSRIILQHSRQSSTQQDTSVVIMNDQEGKKTKKNFSITHYTNTDLFSCNNMERASKSTTCGKVTRSSNGSKLPR